MADENKPKAPGKGAENTLGLIGTIAGLVGNLAFGPDSLGMDFGAPFKLAAQAARDKREQKGLMELLGSHPETAQLMEHGGALIDAGGLANNMDVLDHPDLNDGSQGSVTPPELAQNKAPQSLLTALQNPTTQPAQLDITSPEFLQKAAIYRPDIAEKLVLAQGKSGSELDDLKAILLGQQIANYETPEQKRVARQQERQDNMEFMDKLVQGRQENAANLSKSKITSKEEEALNDIDELKNNYQGLAISLEQGVEPSYMKDTFAKLVPGGERILQSTDPEFSLFRKQAEASLALFQKVISGVAVSEMEARRLRPTQPQAGDDISVLKQSISNNIKKAQELQYIRLSNISKRGGDVSGYIDPESLRKYNLLREAYNTDFEGALKSPKIQALRQSLGIDYSINISKKKEKK